MIHRLQQLIIERIERDGPISFAEYMRMALYEPGHGYYISGDVRVGWEGDFFTSTDVTALFAHCMGRQLRQMWEQLGKPIPFYVLEQGAGREHLAAGVRSWAARDAEDFAAALDYQAQDIRMGRDAVRFPDKDIYSPHVILSNELVDALPVHIVEKRDGRLYEVCIDVQEGRLCEVLDEPGSLEIATYLDHYKISWQSFDEGWRAEINLDALLWIEQIAHLLSEPAHRKHGFLLTIDYGDKARALYTRERHRGTLACYFQHQLTDLPLLRPGEQDITAHVNFSALIEEGRRRGLRLHSLTTQRQWLEGLGIHEESERLRKQDYASIDTERASDRGQTALLQWYNLRQRVSTLTDPYGMGNFKVLIMKK